MMCRTSWSTKPYVNFDLIYWYNHAKKHETLHFLVLSPSVNGMNNATGAMPKEKSTRTRWMNGGGQLTQRQAQKEGNRKVHFIIGTMPIQNANTNSVHHCPPLFWRDEVVSSTLLPSRKNEESTHQTTPLLPVCMSRVPERGMTSAPSQSRLIYTITKRNK